VTALSLKTKMTVAVSLLTAVLLSILAYSAQIYFVDEIKKLVSSQQITMLAALADQIDDKLLTSQNELVSAASTLDRAVLNDPVRLRRFFSGRPDTQAMFDNGLFLFSPQGILLSGNDSKPDLRGRDFSGRDYLKQTLATRRAQISEPLISAQVHHHPIIMFTAPILDKTGSVLAILGGSLDLTKDNFIAKIGSIRLGERGYLSLYNRARFLIANKERGRIMMQDAPLPGVNPMFDKAIAGFEGAGSTLSSRRLPVLYTVRRLKSTGWILASSFPESEAYAPVHQAQRYLPIAVISVFLVSFLVVWLLMSRLTAPLFSFTRQIRELTLGNSARTRVSVETGDEIGVLGEAFNLLLDELDGQKKELKLQLDFSQMLIDSIPVSVLYKDAVGKHLGCNKAFENSSGFSKAQVIGKTVYDLLPHSVAEAHHRGEQELAHSKGMQVFESEVVNFEGIRHSVMFFKTAFSAPDGSHGGVIAAMLDITDRKRAETALAAQKEFAESLVQNSVLPTFVLDDRHRVIIWNRACELLTGINADELLGSDQLWKVFYREQHPVLADLLVDGNPGAISQHYEVYAQSRLTPEGVQAESWFLDKGGNGHYITLNAAPIRDSQGGLVAVIQTLEDITERKLAQDALEKTRHQLQLILDAAGEGVYGIDLEGRVTFVNPAASQMVGWNQGELLGGHHSLLHHAQGHDSPCPVADCPIYSALHLGLTRQVTDEVFWRKDGTSFPVEYVSTPIREGGVLVGAVVIYRDITERKSTENQLLKLSQAVLQSPVPIVISDLSGRVEFVNPMFTRISGYQQGEVVGGTTGILKSGKTRPEVYQSLWSTIGSGRVWAGDLQNRHQNGDLYWVHTTISPIRNSAGAVTHYMAFLESMTERKQLEEQLRQAQKMEAIGQLAGGVAHDFNNILTVIMGFGQLLQQSLDAEDRNRGHMKQILQAAERATHLTNSLLAFSRKQVMLLQPVELNDLTRNHTKFLSRIIGEDVTLRTSFGPEALPVLADSGQIEQVLMNLATNARDAMPGGGELSIRTQSVQLDQEFYRQHGYGATGQYALVTISDTGSGMDEETRNKIFEPFFTTKAPGRGTGLGLSIVYGIVKQHGGYITIDSQLGVGTTFSIYLPLSAAEKRESAGKAPSLAPRGGSETILVVEDDPMVRHLVDAVLVSYGYRVLLAESGEQALKLFESYGQSVDLALLDIVMPRMNGSQVCEALRQRAPQLKVLFLTGYTADLIKDRGILVEGIDLILKPAQPDDLAKKIREMLDAR